MTSWQVKNLAIKDHLSLIKAFQHFSWLTIHFASFHSPPHRSQENYHVQQQQTLQSYQRIWGDQEQSVPYDIAACEVIKLWMPTYVIANMALVCSPLKLFFPNESTVFSIYFTWDAKNIVDYINIHWFIHFEGSMNMN